MAAPIPESDRVFPVRQLQDAAQKTRRESQELIRDLRRRLAELARTAESSLGVIDAHQAVVRRVRQEGEDRKQS